MTQDIPFDTTIPFVCGVPFVVDIPLSSYYYEIIPTINQTIREHLTAELIQTIDLLILSPINLLRITNDFFHEVLRQIKSSEDELVMDSLLHLFVKILPFFLDHIIINELFGLYQSLDSKQLTYLTSCLIESISSTPTSYYVFNGLQTGINLNLESSCVSQTSYLIKTMYYPLHIPQDSFPVIYSLSTNTFQLIIGIDSTTSCIVMQYETFKGNQQKQNGIALSRTYDTQIPTQIDCWNTLVLFHSTTNFVLQLNDQLIQFSIPFPTINESIALSIGNLDKKTGTFFIGFITGIELVFDANTVEEHEHYQPYNYHEYHLKKENNENQPILALNINPIRNVWKSEDIFIKPTEIITNLAPFDSIHISDCNITYLLHRVIQVAERRLNDVFILYSCLQKCIQLIPELPIQNISNIIKLCLALIAHDSILYKHSINNNFLSFVFDKLELVIQRGDSDIIIVYIKQVYLILTILKDSTIVKDSLHRLFALPFKLSIQQQKTYINQMYLLTPPQLLLSHVNIHDYLSPIEIVDIMLSELDTSNHIMFIIYMLELENEHLNDLFNVCISFINNSNWVIFYILWTILQRDTNYNALLQPYTHILKKNISSKSSLVASLCLMIWNQLGEEGEIEIQAFDQLMYDTMLYCSYGKSIESFTNGNPTLKNISFQQSVSVCNFKPILPYFFSSLHSPLSEKQKKYLCEYVLDITCCRSTHNIYKLLVSVPNWLDVFGGIINEFVNTTNLSSSISLFYNLLIVSNTDIRQTIDVLRHSISNEESFFKVLFELLSKFICEGKCDIEVGCMISVIALKKGYGIGCELIDEELYDIVNGYISMLSGHWFKEEWIANFDKSQMNLYLLFTNLLLSHVHVKLIHKCDVIEEYKFLFEMLQFIFPIQPEKLTLSYFVWYTYSIQLFFEHCPKSFLTLKSITIEPISSICHLYNKIYFDLIKMFNDLTFVNVQLHAIQKHFNIHKAHLHSIQSFYFDDEMVFLNDFNTNTKTNLTPSPRLLKSFSVSRPTTYSQRRDTKSFSGSLIMSSNNNPNMKHIMTKKWQDCEILNSEYLQFINEVEEYSVFPRIVSSYKDSIQVLCKSTKLFPMSSLSSHATTKQTTLDGFDSTVPSAWYFSTDVIKNISFPVEFATCPRQCIQHQQLLLESFYSSQHLHEWISRTFLNYRREKKRNLSYNFEKLLKIFGGSRTVMKEPILIGEIYSKSEECKILIGTNCIYLIETNTIKSLGFKSIKLTNWELKWKIQTDNICVPFKDGVVLAAKGMNGIVIESSQKKYISTNYVKDVIDSGQEIVVSTEEDVLFITYEGLITEKIYGCYQLKASNGSIFGVDGRNIFRYSKGIKFYKEMDNTVRFISGGNEITYTLNERSEVECLDIQGEIYFKTSITNVDLLINFSVLTCLMYDFIFITTTENIFVLCNRHDELRILSGMNFSEDFPGQSIKDIQFINFHTKIPDQWITIITGVDSNKYHFYCYQIDYITISKV
ncbi:BEACH domain-containing protein [Entamoeba marina]